MQKNERVRIIPKRIETDTTKIVTRNLVNFGEKTIITTLNPIAKYLTEIKNSFNLKQIKSFLVENEIFLTIDCMNSPISKFILPILAEIGLDESCLLNEKYSSDFSGKTPSPGTGKYGQILPSLLTFILTSFPFFPFCFAF
jgi:phosphomannomutase